MIQLRINLEINLIGNELFKVCILNTFPTIIIRCV